MRWIITILITLFSTVMVEAQSIGLIPSPCSVLYQGGTYTLTTPLRVEYYSEEMNDIMDYLSLYMPVNKVYVNGNLKLNIDDKLEYEQYRLDIYPLGVVISAGGYGGVFNGIQTLMQLMPPSVYRGDIGASVELPYCTIEDAPKYSHRGFMLDVCRTWMDKEAIKGFIDLLAYHKINSLRLHLTDDEAWRIEIESHPELAEIGGFRGGDSPIWPRYGKWNERWGGYYTKADMREIIEYARVRNIEVIPEIDLPGHSLCIATLHPEILCAYTPRTSASFGYDTRSVFCAAREENYALLEDILAEVCELFPSRYIHIGGDEVDMTQWSRCPDCKRLMAEHKMSSVERLQQYFMLHLTDILSKYDKLPAVWNEAIEGGRLSGETLVYGWEGIAECRASAANGYNTIVMPGQYFYFDMKQSPREDGHDWAAIFDWRKLYGFTLDSAGFTPDE
jgi:hexosaminidase